MGPNPDRAPTCGATVELLCGLSGWPFGLLLVGLLLFKCFEWFSYIVFSIVQICTCWGIGEL